MNDKQIKRSLKQVLKSKGFHVEVIESEEKHPDLLMTDGDQRFLIEIKQRIGKRSERAGIVQLNKIARKNTLSGISSKAVEQLDAHRTNDTFNLIWLVSAPEDRDLHYEQMRFTVYGICNVIGKRAGVNVAMECFYVTDSDFYRQRDVLDGVALGNFGGFFLNDYSERYGLLKRTRFVEEFKPAVLDPLELSEAGRLLRLESDVDRNDEAAVKAAIQKNLGIEVISFEYLTRFSI